GFMTGGPSTAPPWEHPGQRNGAGQDNGAGQGQHGPGWQTAAGRAEPQDGQHPYTPPKLPKFMARWGRGPGSPRPVRRERDARMAGGIAAGIAVKTGLDVTAVRVCIVVATLLTGGVGAAFYVSLWLLLPMTGEDTNIASRALADKRGIALAAGLA